MWDKRPLILASASPRRSALLREACVEIEVRPTPLTEPTERPEHVSPRAWAEALAYFKARSVAETAPRRWTLGADTLVACGAQMLGKPRDEHQAREMLIEQARLPSDVITGVALVRTESDAAAEAVGAVSRRIFSDSTRVWMREDAEQRERYLASGDWRGKAGAYGLQDVGDELVERIEGSFSNVVGLPLERLRVVLPTLDEG